jgi:hypothetical protein
MVGLTVKKVFHISEEAGIKRFDPRPPPSIVNGNERPCVWAIDSKHLPNYLFPRDCPRVTFHAIGSTEASDIENHLGNERERHVVAIETRWLQACIHNPIACYAFDATEFHPLDNGAGYVVAYAPVKPLSERIIRSPIEELTKYKVEIRILPNLWGLRDQILASTLQYSFIRMRNAKKGPSHE